AEAPEYEAAGLTHGPANKLFESVRELRRVLGVTDALYACVKADVTIYSQRAGVDLDAASPLVRRAAGLDGGARPEGDRGAVSAAPFVGSFLSVLITRLPRHEDVVLQASHCPNCNHSLGVRDLVPVASFVMTGGACRHCSAPISNLYPAIEISALVVAAWAAT